ncbi:class I SAM-dependent methyltransferase [Sedimentitalea nanhaiensis]|uniref:Methyltransferase domain-containing protein n=1 Tax=Sedimentitalea nanhaiensis TaxID=999627 RepID=A0A1I6Z0H6_9RHOB|nr:class I SAM-dependent methyltransferase [Sedimentitalea nanhaiensis]SFT55931.1 Methyltransferase domain-containing protein [Sedimentitalea nanhaiensis]
MDNQPTRMERATDEFHIALATLDEAMIEVDDLQRKFDQVSGRIETLLMNTAKSPTANLGANLRSLNARSEVLRKALERARKGYAGARKAYHRAAQRHSAFHARHDHSLESAQSALADAERCKAALARTLGALMDRGFGDHAALPSAEERQSLPGHDGSYGYIQIDPARFLDSLIALERLLALDQDYDHPDRRHRPVSFLDVGCGTGRTLMLLRDCGVLDIDTMAGFDINAAQVETGRTLFGLQDNLSVADAMTYDFGGHDVVYSFRPFHDPDKMAAYETHLVATLRPSAYLIAVLPEDLARFANMDCLDPARNIWKKTGG